MLTIYYFAILSIIHVSPIHAELTINHKQTWLDDFALDPLGQNGWNIHQISGFALPDSNPMVSIANTPKYHGPFPPRYNLERYISCNTVNETRLFVTIQTSFCNTDSKNDVLQFSIHDPSETYTMPTWAKYKLYNKDTLLNRNDLAYVQSATANYYTNHASSSSITPQCSQQITTAQPMETTAATSTSMPGEWYSTATHKTYALTIMGQHTYSIMIEMIMSGDADEYVVVSDIAALCVQIHVPTINPTMYPTVNPTTSDPTYIPTVSPTNIPSQTPSNIPTETPTNIPTDTPTNIPTNTPSNIPTQTPTIYTTKESLEVGLTTPDTNKDTVIEEPWCYHCVIYVIMACVGLVVCFLILMCIACVMYRKEEVNRKQNLSAHMNKYKTRPIPKYNEYNDIQDINNNNNEVGMAVVGNYEHTESTRYTEHALNAQEEVEEDGDLEHVEVDVNIMRYDEMDSNHGQQQHIKHQKIKNINSNVTYTSTNVQQNDEYSDDDVLGINALNNENERELKIIDNASCDHLNMDEMDIVDKSDSPYF